MHNHEQHHHEHHSHVCTQDSCGCHHAHDEQTAWRRWMLCAGVFISGLVVTTLWPLSSAVQALWMAVAVLPLLWSLLKEATEEIQDRSIGENTLLVVAVVAAFVIGEWIEGALVLLLFVLGEGIEHKAMEMSRRAVSSLAAVTPDTAWRMDAAGEKMEVSSTQVAVGDVLYLPPHSRVPVDCCVLSGESEVDTSALTGESLPIYCTVGDELMSGSVNGTGELTVTALRINEQSAAARILHLVKDATAQKGRSERFITRFARVYTPAVMAGALLVAVIPPLCDGAWLTWIFRALAFLVASCPCALVISIPLCFYAGIAAAARQGVLIKGGLFVERLARITAVGLDKTGTLTDDVLTVGTVVCSGEVTREEALRIAAAMENHSAHPIGRALCAAADGNGSTVMDLQELAGLGVRGTVNGQEAACGGLRLMEYLKADATAFPPSPVYVWQNGDVIAAINLTTSLRDGAAMAVASLRRLGVSHLAMLTGDRYEAAVSVADAVGLDSVKANLLPEDKLQVVRAWQQAGWTTAFVGDGINDAPVLAAADVGVAMGFGSPAAIETADAVLVSGGLTRLPVAVSLCRRTIHTVRGNIVFSLAVKAIVLLLAVLGLAPMWLAVLADTGVTVLCVLHALRLLLIRK